MQWEVEESAIMNHPPMTSALGGKGGPPKSNVKMGFAWIFKHESAAEYGQGGDKIPSFCGRRMTMVPYIFSVGPRFASNQLY